MTPVEIRNCTLLACQIAVPQVRSRSNMHEHINRMVEKVSQQLDQRNADMVVLPELSTIEYSRETFELMPELAEDLQGQTVETMQGLATAKKSAVVFGMPRVRAGQYFISQVVIDAEGKIAGCYDKLHICQYGASMEKEFFQRGENLCVFDVNGLRFAPIICYDIRIPELSRVLTIDHNVDCILHCGAYFRDESFATWHPFVITRAMENQIFFLSLNRAGRDYGHSLFCPPWVDERHLPSVFEDRSEEFRYLEIDKTKIENARTQYTFLRDRLIDYSALSRRQN